jgi:DNA-binding response OmpR family regulator
MLDRILRDLRFVVLDDTGALKPRVERALPDSHVEIVTSPASLQACVAAGEADLVLIATPTLNDMKLSELTRSLRLLNATTCQIVWNPSPTVEEAVSVLRSGGLDYLSQDLSDDELRRRLRVAVGRRWSDRQAEERLHRLRGAVRRMNRARHQVSRKVDLLCGDFVSAYSDVAEQVEQVRLQRALRDLLGSASDLEQLLCHTMDWLLRHVGHCNIAIFLDDDAGSCELGAYMKHSVAGDDAVIAWIRDRVLPVVTSDRVRRVELDKLANVPQPLDGQAALSLGCSYLAESLASIVIFRAGDAGFSSHDQAVLAGVGPAFAEALTSLVRKDDPDAFESDAAPDPDDWWRTGDAPPF